MSNKKNYVLTKVNSSGDIAHKDLYLTKGIRSTASSKVLDQYIPQYSSTVVQLLEQAGHITKAKLNCDAWAHGSSGENSDYGACENPWKKGYTAGGSSSGSAAAVADGFVSLATGTDTGGSIRLPASFCGVTALKPSYGAVSRYGIVAMASSLDCPGLFAENIQSLRKAYAQIAKADAHDATSQSVARNSHHKTIKTLGVPKEYVEQGLDDAVKDSFDEAVNLYKSMGFTIKQVSLPHTKYGIAVYYLVQTTEVASNLGRYDGIRYGNDRSHFGPEAKRRIMLGTYASSAGYADKYYEQAAKVRTLICQDFSKAFEEVDALIAPTSPTPAFKLGSKVDDPLQMYLSDVLTVNISLAGLPGLSVPGGMTADKLPIGLQLVGPRWSEEALFDVAEQYQAATTWHTMHPENKE